jgi:SAM-dependent methyltransferase
MHWLAKAASLKILSAIPGGEKLYRLGQEKLTRSLDPTPSRVAQKLEVGLEYLNWLEREGAASQLLQGTHLDYGAGWHPTIPLLYYSMGADRQVLCDLRPLLKAKTVAQTVEVFRSIVGEPSWGHRNKIKRLPDAGGLANGPLEAWLQGMGMRYLAPCQDGLAEFDGSVDVITCTQVLYYVARSRLAGCFSQIRSLLKPGGRFLATVRLTTPDLGGLSDYGHLRFSPESWERFFNSSLLSYNLMKAADYREALERAGFKVVHFELNRPTEQDWAEFKQVRRHPDFDRYRPEELACKHLFFLAQK